jgi:hypothetical protein
VKEYKDAVFVIDELRPFFDYKTHATAKQINLYNTLEIARSNRNVFIGASRNYQKLDNNYRNAKAQMLIYLFDKVLDFSKTDERGFYPTLFSYGMVFLANQIVEYEDKFLFSSLKNLDIKRTKFFAERLPTFAGTIIVKDVRKYGVTDEDLRKYEEEKEKGIMNYEVDLKKAKTKQEDEEEEEEEEEEEDLKKEKKRKTKQGRRRKRWKNG